MKNNLLLLGIFTIILTGCNAKNAFGEFGLSSEKEVGVSYLRSAKVVGKDTEIKGSFSALYLNAIYPDMNNSAFYIFFYSKEKSSDLNISLNGKQAIKVEKLSNKNQFSHLVDINNNWNSYYLVEFKKELYPLKLTYTSGDSVPLELVYDKQE